MGGWAFNSGNDRKMSPFRLADDRLAMGKSGNATLAVSLVKPLQA
jgi:hypothetical protein